MTNAAQASRLSQGSSKPLVILARHGRTVLNADGVLRGHLDPPLDDVGWAEVAALGAAVASLLEPCVPVRIVASPLQRAVQTAHAIAAFATAPIHLDQGLIDRDYGRWAGRTREAVLAQFGSLDMADGVESGIAVAKRARAVLDAQRPLLAAGSVILVAHDAVNRLLLADLDPGLGAPDEIGQRTACWNVLTYQSNAWRVREVDQKAPATGIAGPA